MLISDFDAISPHVLRSAHALAGPTLTVRARGERSGAPPLPPRSVSVADKVLAHAVAAGVPDGDSAGAAVGAIAGGGTGAAVGAIIGGGAGAAMRGEDAVIPGETLIGFELRSPVTIQELKK